jgi:hypothetical protein
MTKGGLRRAWGTRFCACSGQPNGAGLCSFHERDPIVDQRARIHESFPLKEKPAELGSEQLRRTAARSETALRSPGGSQTVSVSKALRSRMTKVGPFSRINLFLLRSLNSRVTVSRGAPLRWAISSCAIGDWTRVSWVSPSSADERECCDTATYILRNARLKGTR